MNRKALLAEAMVQQARDCALTAQPDARVSILPDGPYAVPMLRGFETFIMDLAAEPDLACSLLDRVLAYQKARARLTLGAGRGMIDMVEYNDDIDDNGIRASGEFSI